MKQYQEFVLTKLGDIDHVGAIESTFVMSEVKQNYGINLWYLLSANGLGAFATNLEVVEALAIDTDDGTLRDKGMGVDLVNQAEDHVALSFVG